jgi:carbon monoxide dehydrogenase subunit G
MARVTRQRTVAVPLAAVWELVSDPYNLPRWWPRVIRVEGVQGEGDGLQWTKVLGTSEGRSVRADFHCTATVEPERFGWEQDIEGTPFERHLKHYTVEASLVEAGNGTEVTLAASQTLRGMSRLGSPMMRRGQRSLLDEALEGLEGALA